MVVTAAVFQLPMFWLKALAPLNVPNMSVTKAVFQEDIFPLNKVVSSNRYFMLVMVLTFQSFKVVPTKLVHPLNAFVIVVVKERSGSLVAGIVKLVAPSNAPLKDSHFPSPQLVIVLISVLEAWSPSMYILPMSFPASFNVTLIV